MRDPAVSIIDLNADLGENAGDDAAMLGVVTSANVACGAHAGDPATMLRTCLLAAERGVVIGAHPGYADRARFGRVELALTPRALAASLAEQLAGLGAAAQAAGAAVRYVKPHGALYHRASVDAIVAELVVRSASDLDPALGVLAPPGSRLLDDALIGEVGRGFVEGFADRAYVADAGGGVALMSRDRPGAVLEHDAAVEQALMLATTGLAPVVDGAPVPVRPRSICVHGDTPGAVALARDIRAELERVGVVVRAFAP